jgi:hypothetical protein
MRRLLPSIAARIGLRNVESNVIGSMGTFSGSVRGHGVLLEPEQGRISVAGAGSYPVELSEARTHWKPEPGWTSVESPSELFNRRLHKRYVADGVAHVFRRGGPLIEAIVRYLRRYKRRFFESEGNGHLEIGPAGIKDCPLYERHPDYIPVDGLEDRISAMIDILERMDRELSSGSGDLDRGRGVR